MTRVLLDINIIVDALTGRPPSGPDAQQLWLKVEAREVEAVVSAATVTTVFYLIERLVNNATACQAVADLLANCVIWPIDGAVLNAALQRAWRDFEDAVQDVAAKAAGVLAIVTRDPSGFASSALRVVDAATLVNELNAAKP
jgi:predicted nucleic acid-binding protein